MKILRYAFLLLFAFTSFIRSQDIQQLPEGEYRKTCDCFMNNELKLACNCLSGFGTHYSEIDPVQCIGQDIVNSYGKVMCQQFSREKLPTGTYIDSCYDCVYLEPHALKCLCKSSHMQSAIDPRECVGQEVVNCGGALGCSSICQLRGNVEALTRVALFGGVLTLAVIAFRIKHRLGRVYGL